MSSYDLFLTSAASDIQVLKETFPKKTEDEIVQALEAAGSRNEAAEKLLASDHGSELPTPGTSSEVIARYVIPNMKRNSALVRHLSLVFKVLHIHFSSSY